VAEDTIEVNGVELCTESFGDPVGATVGDRVFRPLPANACGRRTSV
jgi:hypothetical protein